MNLSISILTANVISTWFMVGLIWMVQIVHYPLFKDVGEEDYANYQRRHQHRITFIVGPVMLVELVTAILLAMIPVNGVSQTMVYLGILLVAMIWFSTAAIQIPCHARLEKGFDCTAHRWLVNSNWIRTIAWTARGIIMSSILVNLLAGNAT